MNALQTTLVVEKLAVEIYPNTATMGYAAAQAAAQIIREAVSARGVANIILATGNSQLAFLEALRAIPDIPWQAVNAFHMDEYVHLPPGHPAGFPLTLRRNIIDHVQIGNFFPVPGLATDLEAACRGYESLLRAHPADLCCLGIGENGHLAFNEPHDARFDDPQWVKVITLTEASRRQQVGEGHFASIKETPSQAITVTIPALLAAKHVLVIAPESRKAEAVYHTLHDEISAACPATILRTTPHARLFLDADSAAKIL
ncbi:MAG: glucosamine-6-phosphate deaminase [Chloroflexota bacterium]